LFSALIATYECVHVVTCFANAFTYVLHVPFSFTSLETHIKAIKAEDMAVALAGAPMAKSRSAVEEDSDSKKRKAKSKASRGVGILKKVDVSKMVKVSTYFQKK
jgi:ribonuclease H2 subunit B